MSELDGHGRRRHRAPRRASGGRSPSSLRGAGATVHEVDKDDVDLPVSAAVEEFFAGVGDVDILVNVAGGVVGQTHVPIDELTDEAWDAVVDANLRTTMNCTRAAARCDEAPGLRPDREHLLRRRAQREPHRHPGLRLGEGGADRLHPADGPRARPVRDHGQLHRPGLRAVQPLRPRRSGSPTARTASRRCSSGSPTRRIGTPRTSPAASSSSSPRGRLGQRPDAVHRRRPLALLTRGHPDRPGQGPMPDATPVTRDGPHRARRAVLPHPAHLRPAQRDAARHHRVRPPGRRPAAAAASAAAADAFARDRAELAALDPDAARRRRAGRPRRAHRARPAAPAATRTTRCGRPTPRPRATSAGRGWSSRRCRR